MAKTARLQPAFSGGNAQFRPAWVEDAFGTKARPVATISAGAWLPLSGTDLHAMINSEMADLDTWIYADEPTTTRLELGNVSLPELAARALKYYAGGTNGGLKVRLYEGATLIAERTHATLPTTPTQYAMTLTEGELTALTDGTDMFVELESAATFVVRTLEAGGQRLTEDNHIRILE